MAVTRLSLAILFLALLPAQRIDACTCGAFTEEMAFAESDAVFSGVVEAVVPEPVLGFDVFAFIDVLEIWKGEFDTGRLARVVTSRSTSFCGYDFSVGDELVIFASGSGLESTLSTHYCSGTGWMSRTRAA